MTADTKADGRVCSGREEEQPNGGNPAKFKIGDRINLAIFERRDLDEDKWGPAQKRPQQPSHSYLQRAELSGERIVQEDGTIAVPFLGKISVAGATSGQLEAALASAFEREFARPGFVNILSVEHSPVYIVGPVRNAGSFKYTPHMTVLHLVALAGGVERGGNDAWTTVESMRETQKAYRSLEVLARMLARDAVLHAERDGGPVVMPPRLMQLVGGAQAKTILNDEAALRSLNVSTKNTREASLKAGVNSARSELEALQERIPPLDENIKLRSERFRAMSDLNKQGLTSRPALILVQSDLSVVQAQRQEALASVAGARRRLDQAIEEETRFELDSRRELEHEIVAVGREISDNASTILTSQGSIGAMQAQITPTAAATSSAFSYEIVRHTAKGMEIIPVTEISEMEPGDLVRMSATVTFTRSVDVIHANNAPQSGVDALIK